MVGAHCSVFSLITPSNNPITRQTRPLLLVSLIPASNSSKIRRRKNFLRPKILKTLTKPYPPPIVPLLPQELPPQSGSPYLSSQSPEEDDLCLQIPADGTPGENIAAAARTAEVLEELQVSETTSDYNGISGQLTARSIFKYGMYLVGVFVVQTICSVWILGNYNFNQKDGDLEINGREKRNFMFNGNGKSMPVTNASKVFYVEGQLEMEKKIEEIKLMAREARRIEEEKKEEEVGDPETDDESASSSHRLGIEKEISARLLKLQNRIHSDKDNSAALQINSLGNSVKSTGGVARDNMNVNKGNEALIFKKKLKFRSPSTKQTKTPKGFPGIRDRKASDAKKRDSAVGGTAQDYGSEATDHAQILYEDKQVNQQDVKTQKSVSSLRLKGGGKLVDEESKAILNNGNNSEDKTQTPNMQTETGVKKKIISKGGVQETSFGMSTPEVIQSRESREMRTQNSQGFVEENQDTGPIFEKDDGLSINGNSGHGLAKKTSAANTVKIKQANTKTDMWWLNLPYVLVILMQRGSNRDGPKGLYSLKLTSKEQDRNYDSYTVAFEDHADANNFCFLLESFFKDLGDFSADAVPMSIQELNEEVKSHAKKVVVVKKRQLQLYAGQPLGDVEMALCYLIEQDHNVP